MAKNTVDVAVPYKEPRRVNITKASNGYVVSCYHDSGEVMEVAKDWNEAQKLAKKLVGK